jgi:hypothetical protein
LYEYDIWIKLLIKTSYIKEPISGLTSTGATGSFCAVESTYCKNLVTLQVLGKAVASDEISCDGCFNKSDARLLLACLIVYGKRLSEKSTEADSAAVTLNSNANGHQHHFSIASLTE